MHPGLGPRSPMHLAPLRWGGARWSPGVAVGPRSSTAFGVPFRRESIIVINLGKIGSYVVGVPLGSVCDAGQTCCRYLSSVLLIHPPSPPQSRAIDVDGWSAVRVARRGVPSGGFGLRERGGGGARWIVHGCGALGSAALFLGDLTHVSL